MRAVWRQDTWKLGAPGSGPCQGPRLVLGLVLGLGLGLGLRLGPRPGMPKCRQGNISLEVAGATTATGVVITIAMVLSYHYPWRYRGHLRDRWCFHQYRWHDCCCCPHIAVLPSGCGAIAAPQKVLGPLPFKSRITGY